MLPKATTKKKLDIHFFEEVGQEVMIYNIIAIRSYPSSINQLVIM